MNESIKVWENYCDKSMWVDSYVKKDGIDIILQKKYSPKEVKEKIHMIEPGLIAKFLKVYKRMGNKIDYFNVESIIFEASKKVELKISCKYDVQKIAGEYKVIISPMHNYEYNPYETYSEKAIYIEAKENSLTIPVFFENEQEYRVNIFFICGEEEILFISTNVYALNEDLYNLNYFKADLHMHTTLSDGYEPPEMVVLAAREKGLDVIAVTDHNSYRGSVEAERASNELGLKLTVLRGEEYSLEYSPMHILCLGTKEPINRKYITKAIFDIDEVKTEIENNKDISCNVDAYVATQYLLDEIKKQGGVSVLAHPLWKPVFQDGSRIDTPMSMYLELGKDRKFDGIEIVSGSQKDECNVTNLQEIIAREIFNSFDNIPVIGITDSHAYSTDPICGLHYTVIFSKDSDSNSVLDAIKRGMTVAVEHIGKTQQCYGNLRLSLLASFLVRNYFPLRDIEAKMEVYKMKKML